MVPKAVQDAGYTAVGLGVLALQEVQARRRATKARIESQVTRIETQVNSARALAGAVAGQVVRVPALAAAPICGAVETGRSVLGWALRRTDGEAGQN